MASDLVSVLVCTRDRPAEVLRAVRSVLASEGVDIELIVIDQSASPVGITPLELMDPRVRYVKSDAVDKSAALNQGLAVARSDVVICTDDDCEVPPEWVSIMATALRARPTVGAVFSNVVPGPFDSSRGYIPSCQRRESRLFRSLVRATKLIIT